jgi:hypothetical protein
MKVATDGAQRENQPSRSNSGKRPAAVKTGPRTVLDLGATRVRDPLMATIMHHRMTFFSEALVSWSCR